MKKDKSLLNYWYQSPHFKYKVLPSVLLTAPYMLAINFTKEYFRVLNLCLTHQTHKV